MDNFITRAEKFNLSFADILCSVLSVHLTSSKSLVGITGVISEIQKEKKVLFSVIAYPFLPQLTTFLKEIKRFFWELLDALPFIFTYKMG